MILVDWCWHWGAASRASHQLAKYPHPQYLGGYRASKSKYPTVPGASICGRVSTFGHRDMCGMQPEIEIRSVDMTTRDEGFAIRTTAFYGTSMENLFKPKPYLNIFCIWTLHRKNCKDLRGPLLLSLYKSAISIDMRSWKNCVLFTFCRM